MSARAVKPAVSVLADRFSRTTGCAIAFEFAPVGTLEQKLAQSATADVVILSATAIATMQRAGKLIADSIQPLGRTSIGVAVRAGAEVPDISTPQAFEALLLAAKTIAVSDPAVGGTAARYLPKLFERMGIADALEQKLRRCGGGGEVSECVARGVADIGLTFVSEMLPVAGVKVVGPLPAIYGNDTTYCAAVPTTSGRAADARGLIAALRGPATAAAWRAAGFDPDIGAGPREFVG